jgi:T6SS, Phospholipase effector Tle1-like, catalytic domain
MTDTRNLVVCLDGTNNEPEHGVRNVARLYDVAVKDDRQLVYYDPGVGTMGARGAVTQLGQALTRVSGLVTGDTESKTTSKRPTPGCPATTGSATGSMCSDSRAAPTPRVH